MAKMTIDNGWGRMDTYEIVDKIPSGYFVWNIAPIGDDEDYIPLAQWEDKENCTVRLDTLKAIKVGADKAKIISKAASVGVNTKKTAERAVFGKRVNNLKRGRAMLALPIFEQISEVANA